MMETLLVLLWLVFATICAVMAGKKGYSPAVWLILGFLFGIFGVIVVASLPDKTSRKEG